MNPPDNVPRTPLSDERICIRPIGPEDAAAFFTAFLESRESLNAWMHWSGEIRDVASAHAHLNLKAAEWLRGEAFSFAVEASDGAFLGMCGLSQFNWRHRFANVGYWVRLQRRGQGVTPAAVRLLARFGFETLRLQRLEILVEPANAASRRAAEKAGAQYEGLLRARLRNHDQPRHALMFSLIREVPGPA